jgi:hypothetical protein
MVDAAVGSEAVGVGPDVADMALVEVNSGGCFEMEAGGVAATLEAPGGRTGIGNMLGGKCLAVMGAAGWDIAADTESGGIGSSGGIGARIGGAKGLATGSNLGGIGDGGRHRAYVGNGGG